MVASTFGSANGDSPRALTVRYETTTLQRVTPVNHGTANDTGARVPSRSAAPETSVTSVAR